ncbi:MAG: hybrid sensor histidine kinase/response regulator, partial [Marinilabiliales bacterium]
IEEERKTEKNISEPVTKIEKSSISENIEIKGEVVLPHDDIPTSKKTPTDSNVKEKVSSKETVRIQKDKLDPVFLEAEQLIQSKISIAQQLSELNDLRSLMDIWKEDLEKTRKAKIYKADSESDDLFESNNVKLIEIRDNLSSIISNIDEDQRILGRMIDDHLESIKSLLMLPVSTILEGFPKLVRDLSRSQKKNIELLISGESIEVNKRILEELKDPLIHIIRNCVDHGIKESVSDREDNTVNGMINLDLTSSDGRNLEIIIRDNGKGIDTDKVISSAIKQGIITADESKSLTESEKLNLVFKSGISTSPMITDISGRGLGLAIVAEKVEKLGGQISIYSKPNVGTTFKLILPLTISTFRGVLVKSNNQLFFISSGNVSLLSRILKEKVKTIENRNTVEINGDILPLVDLGDVLRIKPINTNNAHISPIDSLQKYLQILVLESDNKRVAFSIDELLDEHQILVKTMGKQLLKVKNISGVSVLGSGKVVPVLNVPDLMDSAISESRKQKAIEEEREVEVKRILVTEDSITSRTLIKEILESAGYYVDTAVDGLDGYIKAQAGNYDLFVSDVDMPRMNGFELTAKIRNDKKLSELPVILVTALGSKEDQEHGIDVGANAYIVKSSFEQSNLLETVNKLI